MKKNAKSIDQRSRILRKDVAMAETLRKFDIVRDPELGDGWVVSVYRSGAVVSFKNEYGGSREIRRPGHKLTLLRRTVELHAAAPQTATPR